MNVKPLRPVHRFIASAVLCLGLVIVMWLGIRDVRWCIVQGGIAGAAFVLLIPVLLRGDSWQKMLAGGMLFFPAFNLVAAAIGAASCL
jgi:hypothetical protein